MAIVNYTESWIDTYNKYLGSINFTEGDFDGLKAVIRDYVTRQNPEGYNDWQQSSEVGMFVNAIAYLGENINYRVDLNVNDLFPETTERKQSLLNFTRMLSYESKRNICANGLAKLVSVSTTQDITDTAGTLLRGVTIKWNDKTNEDWLEQFLTILNSAFVYTNQFGKPTKTVSIDNISNQLYQFNSAVNSSCTYSFTAKVNNKSQQFEVVNPDIDVTAKSITELTPIPERMFNILYRNDGAGNSSVNTGFFVYWKQGTLGSEVYNFDEKIENNSISPNVENINSNDVWFEELNKDTGYVSRIWTKIPASEQLSYTNTDNDIRTIYKVETEENDKITVKFSDGFFGDIPYGVYRLWYRTSNGNDGLYIKPSDIKNVSIQIPYFNNASNEDNIYYLTLTFSIADVSHIRQSVPTETLDSIRENASSIYSTQDRMVNGKDYNYFPRSIGQQLKVLKSIERTYSGNSRFVDINDPTGTYKPVNVLATDGYLYMDTEVVKSTTPTNNGLTAEEIYTKYIEPKFSLKELANVYYQNYDGAFIPENEEAYYYWIPKKIELGQNTMVGVLAKDTDGYNSIAYDIASNSPTVYSEDNISNYSEISDIFKGDVVCFEEYTPTNDGDVSKNNVIWARIEKTSEKEIVISEVLDTNKCWKIRKGDSESKDFSKLMAFNTNIDSTTKSKIISELSNTETNMSFGITYVPPKNTTIEYGQWQVIDESDTTKPYLVTDNLEMVSAQEYISSDYPEDMLVANWFIRINYTNNGWEICSHETKIIFGSVDEASFFFNTSNKDASNDGYFITKDVIKILKNQESGRVYNKDYYWKPYNVIKYSDGYIDTQEFCCEALDGDKDAVIDVPTQYDELTENIQKLIFLKSENSSTMEFLNYNDIYQEYIDLVNSGYNTQKASYESSMWNKQRTLTSGYYYSYHKINQIIPAYGKPKQGTEHLWTPTATVLLSNGTTMAFNHADYILEDKINGTQTYDFVDYIYDYDAEQDREYYFEEIDDEGNIIQNELIEHGFLYYYDSTTKSLELKESGVDYTITDGIKNITFLWKHYPTTDYVIDPCPTNIIDMFVLTNTYYEEVQEWIQNGKKGVFPKAPSAYELKGVFQSLEANKMISDAIVWHPITYKLVFGDNGDVDTHCIFKVIKSDATMSDNEVKKQVIQCIDDYFRNMEVGETFYFTQLSTFVQNKLVDLIKTIVIVPTDTSNKFGDLFQIKCNDNEIILSTASLDDVEIISTITSDNIRM